MYTFTCSSSRIQQTEGTHTAVLLLLYYIVQQYSILFFVECISTHVRIYTSLQQQQQHTPVPQQSNNQTGQEIVKVVLTAAAASKLLSCVISYVHTYVICNIYSYIIHTTLPFSIDPTPFLQTLPNSNPPKILPSPQTKYGNLEFRV